MLLNISGFHTGGHGEFAHIHVKFPNVLYLKPNQKYYLGLRSFHAFNTVHNLEETTLKVSSGGRDEDITIPSGTYSVEDLDVYIRSQLVAWTGRIDVASDEIQLHCGNYEFRLDEPSAFADFLGIEYGTYGVDRIVNATKGNDITKNSVLSVSCNLVHGGLMNGIEEHSLCVFGVAAGPFEFIDYTPSNIAYLPVIGDHISHVNISVRDRNNRAVDFGRSMLTVSLQLVTKAQL